MTDAEEKQLRQYIDQQMQFSFWAREDNIESLALLRDALDTERAKVAKLTAERDRCRDAKASEVSKRVELETKLTAPADASDLERAKACYTNGITTRKWVVIENAARAITEARREGHKAGRVEMREEAAQVADNYGREGDRLSREYACEVADEIAARLRALPDTPADRPPA